MPLQKIICQAVYGLLEDISKSSIPPARPSPQVEACRSRGKFADKFVKHFFDIFNIFLYSFSDFARFGVLLEISVADKKAAVFTATVAWEVFKNICGAVGQQNAETS